MEYILISRNTEILDINQCICQLCVSSCARETEKNNTSTTLFCNLFGECLRSITSILQPQSLKPSKHL